MIQRKGVGVWESKAGAMDEVEWEIWIVLEGCCIPQMVGDSGVSFCK
jgi:hypothetical protein